METANEKHKSSVFSLLFGNPDVLRELYYAIEGVSLPPDVPIKINTLTNVLFKGKVNDLSFLVDNRLVVLIEHQSTINENMPIRLLIYIAEVYKKIDELKKVFQEKLIKIPRPEFIVLYNGDKPCEDHMELRLSDAFKDIGGLKHSDRNPPLELVVRVYNINKGHNSEMLEKSKNLGGYSIFIDKIKECKAKNYTLEESVEIAVKYCLENNILSDFLSFYKSEVVNMILEDLTLDEWLDLRYEEGREEGIGIGEIRGREEIACNALAEGYSTESVQRITGLSYEDIEKLRGQRLSI